MKVKLRYRVLAALLLLVGLDPLWQRPIQIHAKALLLLSQEFPQIPLKPLPRLTNPSVHEHLELESPHGKVVADLFLPTPRFGQERASAQPAVILAMGVRTQAKDRPLLLGFAETLSRLGYVVIWPRHETLDREEALPESPETFVAAFRHLQERNEVARDRISIVSFSVGASLGFVAAADARIADDVRALIFFGGYYDIFDYLVSIVTYGSAFNGQRITWYPDEEMIDYGFVYAIFECL